MSDYQALPEAVVLVGVEVRRGLQLFQVLLKGERAFVVAVEPNVGVEQPLSEAEWREVVRDLKPFYDSLLAFEADEKLIERFVSPGLVRRWGVMTGLPPALASQEIRRYLHWTVLELLRRTERIGERRAAEPPGLTPREKSEEIEAFYREEASRLRRALEEKGAWHRGHLAALQAYARRCLGDGLLGKVLVDGTGSAGTSLEWMRGLEVYQTRFLELSLYFAYESGHLRLVGVMGP